MYVLRIALRVRGHLVVRVACKDELHANHCAIQKWDDNKPQTI